MDYRALLKRYIALVVDREGTSQAEFNGHHTANRLSADDVAVIQAIEEEVQAEEAAAYEARHAPA